GWRAGNDLGAATSCHVAANQPRRATRRRGRDRAQRSTPGEPNDGCGRARGRLGICAYDQQLDIVQCVIDPLEDGREDLSDRGPVVRLLVDDVLPTRHSWLSCFVIHFTLDCALATLWHTDLPVPSIAGPTSIAVSGTPTKSSVDSATTAPFAHFAHDVRTLYTFRQHCRSRRVGDDRSVGARQGIARVGPSCNRSRRGRAGLSDAVLHSRKRQTRARCRCDALYARRGDSPTARSHRRARERAIDGS